MNNLQIFKAPKSGQVRTVKVNSKIHFVDLDTIKLLVYVISSKTINMYCKGVSKMEVPADGGVQEMIVIAKGYG